MIKFITLAMLFLCQQAFSQQILEAEYLEPEDLGAYKWIFSGSPGKDKVLIIRETRIETRSEEVGSTVYDTVCYSPFKGVRATIMFIDTDFFNRERESDPTWHYRVLGSVGSLSGKRSRHSSSGDKVDITFERENGDKTTMMYEVFMMPYAKAVLAYEDLPPIEPNSGWRWGAHFENGGEPDLEE